MNCKSIRVNLYWHKQQVQKCTQIYLIFPINTVLYQPSGLKSQMPPAKNKDNDSEDEDYSEEESGDDEEKVIIKKPKVQRLDNMKNLKKITINVSMTQYPVVIEVAQQLGWKVQYSADAGDWDILWTDWHIEPDVLIKMHLFQKISHYPGIHTLARKNLLGMNLMGMREAFPEQYNFFPLTWMLPQQYVEFRTYFESKPKGKARTYIVKPEADCQGRGIFLTRKIQPIENGKHYVVQRYISRPFLIDNLKFDMRIYVLIGSVNPLRIYLFEDGLARFATQPYIEPSVSNLEKQYMHLTNYAINKKNPKFVFNNNASNMGVGHKRSLLCVMKQIQAQGVNIQELKNQIKDLIIKTIITGLPIMSHQYKCSQPQDYTGNMCFHILGFDVMLKSNGEPILLEVNHTPSFTTDTPLDFKIKKALIKDTLKIMNVNVAKKTELYNLSMENNQARLLTGKRNILEGKQREEMIAKHEREREQYEKNNLGGFEVIYPCKDTQKINLYKTLIDHCNKQYFDEKGSVRIKMAERQAKRLARQEYKQLKKNKKSQKQKQKQKANLSKSNYQSTQQTSDPQSTPIKISQKFSTPVAQIETPIKIEKKKIIDNSQIPIKIQETERTRHSQYTNASSVKNYKKNKTQFQKNGLFEDSLNFKISKLPIQDHAKLLERRNPTPLKGLLQKATELPFITDTLSQLSQKSNLIIGSQYDRRRYIKGSGNIQKQTVHRSTSGKTYSMAKSTTAVQNQKQDLSNRQNLSSLMARKRFEEKLNEKNKFFDAKNISETKKQGTKIQYNNNAFSSNYNPTAQNNNNNGQFLMPKIFCLNFESDKNMDQNMKFLLFKNFEHQLK